MEMRTDLSRWVYTQLCLSNRQPFSLHDILHSAHLDNCKIRGVYSKYVVVQYPMQLAKQKVAK